MSKNNVLLNLALPSDVCLENVEKCLKVEQTKYSESDIKSWILPTARDHQKIS